MSELVVFPMLAPLESLQLSRELDGGTGTNRAIGNRPQIAAATDVEALRAWLARVADVRPTFDTYRKEAERLVLWSVIERGKPLSSLGHEDLLIYQRFLADPQPADRWVMPPGRRRARADAHWRPFAGALAPTSQRQAMVILNAMFAWLVSAGYLAGNPLSLSRQRQRQAKPRITRMLEQELWWEVRCAIVAMPHETERQRQHYSRVRWLFSLLYICGLRISEVTQNSMGAFFSQRDQLGVERWWLEITGKGAKTRLIPATSELMVELARYRREHALPPCPLAGESIPLILPIGGQPRALTRSAVHAIVKQVFAMTARHIHAQGPQHAVRAALLAQASAHWLRHTAASNMSNTMDLKHVRDNLGHVSIATTSRYLHSADDLRHEQTQTHHRLGW